MKNEQESMSWTDNCKQVKKEPANPETHEICHVTKFGNWEFEGLEALVKGETEPRLTGTMRIHNKLRQWKAVSHLTYNLLLILLNATSYLNEKFF